MHLCPIKKLRLHVLHFCPIEAGPCNIVEGTAAAKGAVPPEGWGRECEEGTTEHEGTGPFHANPWRGLCLCVKPLRRGYKGHDTGAAEGGQPGGAPWWRPRIPATAEGSKGRSRPERAKRWRGCTRGRTAGDVQRSSTMTACEASASTRRADGRCAAQRNRARTGLACVLDGDGRLTADL
jgi:hypothetical protein